MNLARTACRSRCRETRDAASHAVKLVNASHKICKDELRDTADNNVEPVVALHKKEHKLDSFNATSRAAILPPSHVLTEVQTVKVVRDARTIVFAPEVTLPLVQSTAMRVSIHGSQNQRHYDTHCCNGERSTNQPKGSTLRTPREFLEVVLAKHQDPQLGFAKHEDPHSVLLSIKIFISVLPSIKILGLAKHQSSHLGLAKHEDLVSVLHSMRIPSRSCQTSRSSTLSCQTSRSQNCVLAKHQDPHLCLAKHEDPK